MDVTPAFFPGTGYLLALPAQLSYPFGFAQGEPGLAALCKMLLTFQRVGFHFYTHQCCYGSSSL